MANTYGQSFFGDLEARLAHGLDLKGQVGPVPELAKPQAVLVIQDYSGLGYAGDFRGRQFYYRGQQNAGAAVASFSVRSTADVLIEQMVITLRNSAAGGGLIIRLYGPSDTMANEPSLGTLSTRGMFLDHCSSVTERPPLSDALSNAVAPSGGQLVLSVTATSAIDTRDVPFPNYSDFLTPMVLAQGCGLVFSGSVTTDNLQLMMRGRVL